MKFTSASSALRVAIILALALPTAALAQTAHQHTEAAPPVAASQATPPGMMQMPPGMMQMMRKMHGGALPRMAMMGGSLMAPGGAIQNVEGHIAFLKAELKITDAQQKSWDQFADALRTNAKLLSGAPSTMIDGMMGAMISGADKKMSLAARLEQQEKTLTLHLEAVERSLTALEGLKAVLSDEQQKQLDELI